MRNHSASIERDVFLLGREPKLEFRITGPAAGLVLKRVASGS